MTWLLRALAATVLLANLAILLVVAGGLWRDAPGWVALHYAPTQATGRCDATVTRLRAAIRRQRRAEPTGEQEAALSRLRASEHCDDGDAEVVAIEGEIGGE